MKHLWIAIVFGYFECYCIPIYSLEIRQHLIQALFQSSSSSTSKKSIDSPACRPTLKDLLLTSKAFGEVTNLKLWWTKFPEVLKLSATTTYFYPRMLRLLETTTKNQSKLSKSSWIHHESPHFHPLSSFFPANFRQISLPAACIHLSSRSTITTLDKKRSNMTSPVPSTGTGGSPNPSPVHSATLGRRRNSMQAWSRVVFESLFEGRVFFGNGRNVFFHGKS